MNKIHSKSVKPPHRTQKKSLMLQSTQRPYGRKHKNLPNIPEKICEIEMLDD